MPDAFSPPAIMRSILRLRSRIILRSTARSVILYCGIIYRLPNDTRLSAMSSFSLFLSFGADSKLLSTELARFFSILSIFWFEFWLNSFVLVMTDLERAFNAFLELSLNYWLVKFMLSPPTIFGRKLFFFDFRILIFFNGTCDYGLFSTVVAEVYYVWPANPVAAIVGNSAAVMMLLLLFLRRKSRTFNSRSISAC